MTATRPHLPITVIGVLLPAVVSVAGIVVALAALPGSAEIAVHWGIDGSPDNFAPAWSVVVILAIVSLAAVLCFGLVLGASEGDGPTVTRQVLAVAALFLAVLLSVLAAWTILSQRDGSSAPVWQGLVLAGGAALLAAATAALLLPPTIGVAASASPAEPLPLGATERAVWIGRARLATPGVIAISAAIAFAAVAGVVVAIASDGRAAAALLLPVVLLLALLMTSFWTVRVDDAGLTVRSASGWPRFHTPAAQIVSAGTIEVTPLGEFGGWGIRFGRGRRLGVVMRSGVALEVQKRDGSALVVTVDDAAAAAGLLNAVAARAR